MGTAHQIVIHSGARLLWSNCKSNTRCDLGIPWVFAWIKNYPDTRFKSVSSKRIAMESSALFAVHNNFLLVMRSGLVETV